MNEAVLRFDATREYPTAERCHIVETSNGDDDPSLSIARARVAPGITTRWHRLRETAERYLIVEGTARVEIGERPAVDVGPGDAVLIPPMCRQRITNTGADDLLFLAICTPRYRDADYEDLGDDEPARDLRQVQEVGG